MSLMLYNTLTRKKDAFVPIDPANVRMYVCGPTVYDFAHIGNARPVIVFDVLFRLLRKVYGPAQVTYARNITDVDDKINNRAAELWPNVPPTEAIRKLTTETTAQFHKDIAALGVLEPSVEPRATDHIEDMKALCEALVAKGHAYLAQDHVLFNAASMPDYGRLANRSLEEMEAGARVDVAPYKKGVTDFVLWKPSTREQPGWPSPCGITTPGRPGWHIECSAMAGKHLGRVFDIHGGGIDLVFPHHENEVAQSRCAYGTPAMANVWMHNGFLLVNGEKMSKSTGNFITINQLLAAKSFGNQQWPGRVLRFAMLGSHYRQPLDWTVERLVRARATLAEFATLLHDVPVASEPHGEVIAALSDDLNTPSAISILHGIAKSVSRNKEAAGQLKSSLQFMGLYDNERAAVFAGGVDPASIDRLKVRELIEERLAARRAKDFKESDRLRDELFGMGIEIKDAKDPKTGELVTNWEVKR